MKKTRKWINLFYVVMAYELKCWIWIDPFEYISLNVGWSFSIFFRCYFSDESSVRQAHREVVKIKIWIFPTGLEVHLEDIFWVYKNCAKILCWAEQSGTQFFSLSNLLVFLTLFEALCLHLSDIWWSSLDILDDFKLISRTVFFCLGEINK